MEDIGISEALRLIRVFHDDNLKQLAGNLKMPMSYISEIENGKKSPSLEIIRRYADEYSTKASSILIFSEIIKEGGEDMHIRTKIKLFVKYVIM